ncbi:MAG: nitroreductase family protein [Candidatus Thorarchaeota archaeon]|nr:nitroreductase family protein [Candidatus Thorarchaeota archaeon]
MDALEAIRTRRSIRKYEARPVSSDMIEQILRAGMSAPSAGNQQAWQFVVITDRDILDKIPSVHPYSKMVREVSVAILVCGDLDAEKYKGFWIQDCSAATQNMLLAAHALGLASVWLGIHPRTEREEGLKRLLGLPEHIVPLALLPIGYPAEKKAPEDRYRKEKVHHNKW